MPQRRRPDPRPLRAPANLKPRGPPAAGRQCPRVITERPRALTQRYTLHFRMPSIQSLLPSSETLARYLASLRRALETLYRDAERQVRRAPRLSAGVAAATTLAVFGVLVGMSVGSAAPAAAVSATDEVAAAPAQHAGHQAGPASAPSAAAQGGTVHGSAPAPAQAAAPAHAAPAHAAPAAPAGPHMIYDSTNPTQIPGNQHDIATYADGPHPVSASQTTGRSVLWIDTTGSDPKAAVLDVEPGCATPQAAAPWAKAKLSASPNGVARIYTMLSDWPAVKAAISTLPSSMQHRVQWWIADPTGHPHIVPGAQATQWYWGQNYDISSAAPGF